MTNSQRLAAVRDHLRRWLCEHTSPTISECGDIEQPEPEQFGPEQFGPEQPENADEEPDGQREVVESATTEIEENGSSECDDASPADVSSPEISAETPEISSESILIRDGFYAGRTFEASAGGDLFRATWFMEPDELKIRDPQGNVLVVFQGDEIVATPLTVPIATDDPADRETVSLPMLPAAEKTPPAKDDHFDGEGQITKAA